MEDLSRRSRITKEMRCTLRNSRALRVRAASVKDLGGHATEFRFEILPPCVYYPIMANTSSMELLTSSGVDPKTAEALGKFVEKTVNNSIEAAVEKAVEKAVKSLEIAAQSRPQETAERTAPKTTTVFTGIIALAALATLQLGLFYRLDNTIRSEVSGVNGEISDLRSDMREDFRLLEAKFEAKFDEVWAELAELRSEIGALSEWMARIEVVMQDRLPAAP